MFQQLNEFKYEAGTGKIYIIYFLKFWHATERPNDYVVKYQIRAPDKDFVWYGRISKARFMIDHKVTDENIAAITQGELENRIQSHLRQLFIHVMKKGLDKGFEEPNTEFAFYEQPPVIKRVWHEAT